MKQSGKLKPYVEVIRYRASRGEPVYRLAKEYRAHPKSVQAIVDFESYRKR